MSAAFAWLDELVRAIAKVIPRLVLVRSTYNAVIFHRAGRTEVKKPGLCWYWPLIADIRLVPVTQRVFRATGVAVGGAKGPWGIPMAMLATGNVRARVFDPLLAVSVYHIGAWSEATIANMLCEAYRVCTSDEELGDHFERLAVKEFERVGYRVWDTRIVDINDRITLGYERDYHRLESSKGDSDEPRE